MIGVYIVACGREKQTVTVTVPDPDYDGVPITPGWDCRDLGDPTGECVGFIEGSPDCGGTVVGATPGFTEHCLSDQSLKEWCHDHLPCWAEVECPTFYEFLWASGWIPSDLPDESGYEWTSAYTTHAVAAITARCWYGEEEPRVYDQFYWRSDRDRIAIFDAVTAEMLAVVEFNACCGDVIVPERWWGTSPGYPLGCDHRWPDTRWEQCAADPDAKP